MMLHPADILWTAAEADAVTGGRSTAPWLASGVCLKMEALKPGDLFFAGAEDDLAQAALKGAAAAVVPSRYEAAREAGSPLPLVCVGDVFEAMRDLAMAARFRTHGIVMAVQGCAREPMQRALESVSQVHEGGRHLSLGLSAMPEHCDFGVFGFSPFVRPDVAVISDCQAALNSTVIESLPDNGVVIINADDAAFADVYNRAKACGTRSLYTYGANTTADARLTSHVAGANGAQLGLRILGDEATVSLPQGLLFDASALAALLVLKLMDRPLSRHAHEVVIGAATPCNAPLPNLMVLPQSGPSESAFRIKSVIDLGARGRTAVLDNVRGMTDQALSVARNDLAVPHQLGALNLVYACKDVSVFADAQRQLSFARRNMRAEPITADVLVPGDFLIFRQIWRSSKNVFSQALRLVPGNVPRNVEEPC